VLRPWTNLATTSELAPYPLGAPHAGIGLGGQAAEPAEHAGASESADPVPRRVADQRGGRARARAMSRLRWPLPASPPGGQKKRLRWEREADLLGEDRAEHD
jgi:hypothetical protein